MTKLKFDPTPAVHNLGTNRMLLFASESLTFAKRLTVEEVFDVIFGAVVGETPEADDALGRLATTELIATAALVHHPLHLAILGPEN